MTLATRSISTAQRLLAKYGESLVFTRTTKGAYDPATGTSVDTTTDYTVSGHPADYAQSLINGADIQAGDVVLMIESDGVYVPEANDTVLFNGVTISVVAVPEKVRVQGSAIYFVVQARK